MKTLGKLKLFAVSAALVLGMSSCLKVDNKFEIYATSAYILQQGGKYQLQIQLQGNEQMKSASASFNGKNYSFSAMDGSQNFYWQIQNSYFNEQDSIAEGICTITAYNIEGTSATGQIHFYSTDKEIGDFTLTKLDYKANGEVSAEWNKVENAEYYYLLYRIKGEGMWLPYGTPLTVNNAENPAATKTIPFTEGERYEIAIGATYKTTLKVSDQTLLVIGGTATSIN